MSLPCKIKVDGEAFHRNGSGKQSRTCTVPHNHAMHPYTCIGSCSILSLQIIGLAANYVGMMHGTVQAGAAKLTPHNRK